MSYPNSINSAVVNELRHCPTTYPDPKWLWYSLAMGLIMTCVAVLMVVVDFFFTATNSYLYWSIGGFIYGVMWIGLIRKLKTDLGIAKQFEEGLSRVVYLRHIIDVENTVVKFVEIEGSTFHRLKELNRTVSEGEINISKILACENSGGHSWGGKEKSFRPTPQGLEPDPYDFEYYRRCIRCGLTDAGSSQESIKRWDAAIEKAKRSIMELQNTRDYQLDYANNKRAKEQRDLRLKWIREQIFLLLEDLHSIANKSSVMKKEWEWLKKTVNDSNVLQSRTKY